MNYKDELDKVNEDFPNTLKSLNDKESYWNYRVVRKDEFYGIHEVHYCGGGKVQHITENPVAVEAEDRSGVKWVLRMMQANWVLPPIDYETLEELDDLI